MYSMMTLVAIDDSTMQTVTVTPCLWSDFIVH